MFSAGRRLPQLLVRCALLILLLQHTCVESFAAKGGLQFNRLTANKPTAARALPPSLRSAHVLRGGSMSAVSDAMTLMGQIITPSALLAGASLTALTGMENSDEPKTKKIKSINIMCAYLAYGLLLSTVVGSCMTCIRLVAGGYDPTASNGVALLLREFEVLFTTVQLTFSMGVVAFLSTIITRTWVVYSAESERPLCNAITTLLGIISMTLLRMMISPVVGMPSLGNRLTRYMRLLWRDVLCTPSAVVGVAIIAMLIRYSDTRKLKEDRGLGYKFNSWFSPKRSPAAIARANAAAANSDEKIE